MSPTQETLRQRRSRSKPGSARNGAVRVVCFVAPEEAERVARVCVELGITRGQLLVRAAVESPNGLDYSSMTEDSLRRLSDYGNTSQICNAAARELLKRGTR